jgi:hypothetical protein
MWDMIQSYYQYIVVLGQILSRQESTLYMAKVLQQHQREPFVLGNEDTMMRQRIVHHYLSDTARLL